VPSQKELIKPGKFIRDQQLTLWFSAPSTAILMKRFSMLKPDSYPTLRFSLFAGEALPVEVARSWLEAAPGTIVENLYGPTEATVVCVLYRWDPETSPDDCEMGVVPIGHAVPGLSALVVDDKLEEVAPGEQGELLIAGPQVTKGYWRDPDKTAAAFVLPPGRDETHYRTGDRVRRPARDGGPIPYLGRIDHQVKVRGVRIELGEVEAVLREASGVDAVVAIGWPKEATGAGGIEAFIGQTDVNVDAVRAFAEGKLPSQAVPRGIHTLRELPLNSNGKFDRKALTAILEESA
jgi:acyl-coenzyme A synthetase/AMP-(fatty) acid ligase